MVQWCWETCSAGRPTNLNNNRTMAFCAFSSADGAVLGVLLSPIISFSFFLSLRDGPI